MAYKGKFTPKNRNKYTGNINRIVFRSLWERRFMIYCDDNPKVLKWSSEELKIKYISPIDKRWHTYWPDFYIMIKGSGTNAWKIQEMVVEIKPKKYCKPPKEGKNKKTFLWESKNFVINTAKWEAAKEFCKRQKWEFKILTEDQLLP